MKRNNLFILGIISMLVIASVGAIRTQASRLVYSPITLPIAAGAGGGDGVAEYTWQTPNRSTAHVNCADTDGCEFFFSETAVRNGQVLRIFNISANNVTVRETSGVREMSSDFTAGQYDHIDFQYVTDRWVQVNEHNN